MADAVPEIVQPAEFAGRAGALPIIFIHDGGGTVWAYHCMDSLRRPVYGIPNPRFHDGGRWEGGIVEMATLYTNMIRRLVVSSEFRRDMNAYNGIPPPLATAVEGPVKLLLGGWSLGGALSLEVAHMLRDDPVIEVVGIVMVDTIYPLNAEELAEVYKTIVPLPQQSDNLQTQSGTEKQASPPQIILPTKTATQLKADKCMLAAGEMIRLWTPPAWSGLPTGLTPATSDSSTTASKTTSIVPSVGPNGTDALKLLRPPPVILVRALQNIPTFPGYPISAIDYHRQDPSLGWRQHYHPDFFKRIIDIPGHHFDIFAEPRIKRTSAAIRGACDMVERAQSALDIDATFVGF
jgi:pimeloyl-ACP methyl ester carboxylesterase